VDSPSLRRQPNKVTNRMAYASLQPPVVASARHPTMRSRAGASLVVALLLWSPSLVAQSGQPTGGSESRPPWALWVSITAAATATVKGDAAAVALSYQRGRRLLSARFAGVEGPPCTVGDCWPDALDLSVLYGVTSAPGRRLLAAAAAGLGIASHRNSGGVAPAVELQATWRATRVLGVGLYGWGNMKGPQAGIGVAFTAGRLR
jgi:hypothetical protein